RTFQEFPVRPLRQPSRRCPVCHVSRARIESPDQACNPDDLRAARDARAVAVSGPVNEDVEPVEVALPGGNVGGAKLVGDVVLRPTGPWTPAVHALLDHLHRVGLDSIPRVLGVDDQGREMLTYIPGRSIAADSEFVGDALLTSAVAWLRRFHDAAATFRPSGVRRWRHGPRALAEHEIVCHNDPGAYNWIVDGDRVVGVIDWDMAGPGVPI